MRILIDGQTGQVFEGNEGVAQLKAYAERFFKFIYSIKHGFWLLIYPLLGLVFQWIERVNAHVDIWISCSLDAKIPFINVFVIPYIFWFWFIVAILAALVLRDKQNLLRACASIYIGMIVCFIVYLIYPHGQPLRVDFPPGDRNIFDRLVDYIYDHDTPTNTLPSIHVLNSIAANYAFLTSPAFKKQKALRIASRVFNLLIIMSTVLIKQHSILDVIAAVVLAYMIRFFVYYIDWAQIFKRRRMALGGEK